jgi:uncharacterized protein with HEPN domain
MSADRRDEDSLFDIYEAIERILSYVDGQSFKNFEGDLKTQDAVIRNLEVIGEATKNLSLQFRNSYPQFPWKEMAGLRDRLIHHYFGINNEIVWQIVQNELPGLRSKIQQILPDFNPKK